MSGIVHYYGDAAGRFACGLLDDGEGSPYLKDVTCQACLDVAHQKPSVVRVAVEKAGNTVGSVAMNLSVWEGRGDWARQPEDDRRKAGLRGLAHLDAAIAELEAQRGPLRAALGLTPGLGVDLDHGLADEDGPAVACSLVHEHNPEACGPDWADMAPARFPVARTMSGYETEEQARADAASLIQDSRDTWELGASPRQIRADYLESALRAAGVELGAFDDAIVGWLAGWEPETVQAVVRWIEAAWLAGKAAE